MDTVRELSCKIVDLFDELLCDENIVISSGNISLNPELSNITKISSYGDLVIDIRGSLKYKGKNIDSSLVHNKIIGKTPPNIDINLTDGNNPIYNLGTINSNNSDITIIPPVVRADYIRALQESNHNKFTPFINFISEMVLESQKEYLRIIESLS